MLTILWGGGVWDEIGRDLHGYFLPRYEAVGRALLQEGRLPLWNPYEFCGAPLFGSIQSATLYPPVPLLFGTLSPWSALQAFYGLHALVLCWATITYLRSHGVPRICGAVGATVALSGVFSGWNYAGLNHPNFPATMAWIPILLLCFDRAIRTPRPWLGFMAIAYAMQWLAGYPDFPLDMSVVLGIVALLHPEGTLPRRAGVLLTALALGTALAGFQMLPAIEAIGQSVRAGDATSYVGVRDFFKVPDAGFLFDSLSQRFGLAALLLLAIGVIGLDRIRAGWLIAIVWCLMALNWPLNLLYHLPPFSGVRLPYGWNHIVGVLIGFVVAATAAHWWTRLDDAPRVRAVARAAIVALSVFAIVASWRATVRLRTVLDPSPDYAVQVERMRALAMLRERLGPQLRIVSGPDASAGGLLRHGIPSITGYDPSGPLRRPVRLLQAIEGLGRLPGAHVALEQGPRLASLMGIGLYVVPSKWAQAVQRAGFVRVGRLAHDDTVLYRRPVARARLVHRAIAVPDEATSLEATIDPTRDIENTTVIESTAPLPGLSPVPQGARERATIVLDRPERVEVAVEAAADAILVLSDTYYPGWEVLVDGQPAPVWAADYAFRGVALSRGRHLVVFRFVPRSLYAGLAVSLVACCLLAWLVAPLFTAARHGNHRLVPGSVGPS